MTSNGKALCEAFNRRASKDMQLYKTATAVKAAALKKQALFGWGPLIETQTVPIGPGAYLHELGDKMKMKGSTNLALGALKGLQVAGKGVKNYWQNMSQGQGVLHGLGNIGRDVLQSPWKLNYAANALGKINPALGGLMGVTGGLAGLYAVGKGQVQNAWQGWKGTPFGQDVSNMFGKATSAIGGSRFGQHMGNIKNYFFGGPGTQVNP